MVLVRRAIQGPFVGYQLFNTRLGSLLRRREPSSTARAAGATTAPEPTDLGAATVLPVRWGATITRTSSSIMPRLRSRVDPAVRRRACGGRVRARGEVRRPSAAAHHRAHHAPPLGPRGRQRGPPDPLSQDHRRGRRGRGMPGSHPWRDRRRGAPARGHGGDRAVHPVPHLGSCGLPRPRGGCGGRRGGAADNRAAACGASGALLGRLRVCWRLRQVFRGGRWAHALRGASHRPRRPLPRQGDAPVPGPRVHRCQPGVRRRPSNGDARAGWTGRCAEGRGWPPRCPRAGPRNVGTIPSAVRQRPCSRGASRSRASTAWTVLRTRGATSKAHHGLGARDETRAAQAAAVTRAACPEGSVQIFRGQYNE